MRHERPVVLPAPVASEWDWQLRADCRTHDVSIFFDREDDAAQSAKARAVCAQCPVLEQCREYAIDAGEPHGIWGGLSARERNRQRWLRPRPLHDHRSTS
ncbi:WhiB family transcriptional regulator [Rhodococcus koreensis]|uniref:Transcriptional regulator WhiB n=1 Tax=Rhodococcus koreensis TaxID=99653 RepID=A0A1H4KXG3_9NOCA|nr:WhiB family transcriptional regulator [Rhodococcus koreensis]SEB62785.1 WhiB family transcriptional regulator, redox-sensing transcriptional regulator [Rhodococcus koreensis]